jgi:cytochrome c oxidase subunit 2
MQQTQYDWLPLPPDFSTHGPQVDSLIWYVHALMFLLFIGWGIYFIFVLIRFRQREGHRAQYAPVKAKPAKYIEFGVIIAEAFLLIALSMPAWAKYKERPDAAGALRVRVVGEQFAWNFHYPGRDGIFGRRDVKFVDNVSNSMGLDPSDPNGKDDIVSLNEFHIPVNRRVIADITSKDVIHSFTLNVLRVKQDAVPGMVIPIHFEATQTGEFDISCAQLCGNSHYRMKGYLYIDTPQAFNEWIAARESELQGVN